MNTVNINQNIANIFKATRKFNRLGQTEFAAILEVTQGTISKIEAGIMHPELGLWFKFLRSFNIADPYCFTSGGVEFREDAFSFLKSDGASLLPQFNVGSEKTIFTVRTIRPIFDFMINHHFKAFETFLKKNKISIELFYILNHPLTFDFADKFFSFLEANKINEKSVAHLDLSFDSFAFDNQSGNTPKLKSPELFFNILNKEKDNFVKYKLNEQTKTYTVSLNKKKLALVDSMTTKDVVMNYNILYPYHFLKSTNQGGSKAPQVKEMVKNMEWQISYAS